MRAVLLSWIGAADLDAAAAGDPADPGPIGRIVLGRTFDHIVLLADYPKARRDQYRAFLRGLGRGAVTVRPQDLGGNPMDYAAIHAAAVDGFAWIEREFGEDVQVTVSVTSGTPAMHAVWVLLCKTRYPAELLQVSRERGVAGVDVPFDISAEFLPQLLNRRDRRLEKLAEGLPPESPDFEEILGSSSAIQTAKTRARRAAVSSFPILIEGESGTGKELFARAIHSVSPRADGPFVGVNCGALPEGLAESLLFGHEKGAFTGADSLSRGYFEVASGGTLFLDEIGELPLHLQVKLLRALQESAVQRMGSPRLTAVDVRVIAATNRSLPSEVHEGRFRGDLYHRLAVLVIQLPPLRVREGDVGLLVDHFVDACNRSLAGQPGFEAKRITPSARNLLARQGWPGNVRQLGNVIMRLSVWTPGGEITESDVRVELREQEVSGGDGVLGRPLGDGFDLQQVIGELVGHYIDRALDESGGTLSGAAELLGFKHYQTLSNWVERHREFITHPRAHTK